MLFPSLGGYMVKNTIDIILTYMLKIKNTLDIIKKIC